MGIKLEGRRLGKKSRKHFALCASLEAAAAAYVSLGFDRVWRDGWMLRLVLVNIVVPKNIPRHQISILCTAKLLEWLLGGFILDQRSEWFPGTIQDVPWVRGDSQ